MAKNSENHVFLDNISISSIRQYDSVSAISVDPIDTGIKKPVSGILAQALRGVYIQRNRPEELCDIAICVDPEFKFLASHDQQSTSEVRTHSVQAVEAFTHSYNIVGRSVQLSKVHAGLGTVDELPPYTGFYHYSVHRTVPTMCCMLEKESLRLSQPLISELKTLQVQISSGCDKVYTQSRCESILRRYGSHVYVGHVHFGGIYSWEASYLGVDKDAHTVCQHVESAVADMTSTAACVPSVWEDVTMCASKKKGGPCYAPSFDLWKMGLESDSDRWTLIDRGEDAVGIWDILLNHWPEIENVTHLREELLTAWERMTLQQCREQDVQNHYYNVQTPSETMHLGCISPQTVDPRNTANIRSFMPLNTDMTQSLKLSDLASKETGLSSGVHTEPKYVISIENQEKPTTDEGLTLDIPSNVTKMVATHHHEMEKVGMESSRQGNLKYTPDNLVTHVATKDPPECETTLNQPSKEVVLSLGGLSLDIPSNVARKVAPHNHEMEKVGMESSSQVNLKYAADHLSPQVSTQEDPLMVAEGLSSANNCQKQLQQQTGHRECENTLNQPSFVTSKVKPVIPVCVDHINLAERSNSHMSGRVSVALSSVEDTGDHFGTNISAQQLSTTNKDLNSGDQSRIKPQQYRDPGLSDHTSRIQLPQQINRSACAPFEEKSTLKPEFDPCKEQKVVASDTTSGNITNHAGQASAMGSSDCQPSSPDNRATSSSGDVNNRSDEKLNFPFQPNLEGKSGSPPSEAWSKLLKVLKLDQYYPEKISTQDVMQIEELRSDNETSIGDVPWNILQRLIMLDRNGLTAEVANCTQYSEYTEVDEDVFGISGLNPLDVFLAIFVCCDLNLRQLLIEKMNQCRLAVPFLFPSPNVQGLTFSLWALRAISLTWRDVSQVAIDTLASNCPLKIVSSIRLGKCGLEKSKLLNHLVNGNDSGAFVTADTANGDNPKIISNGFVEGTFYLPNGKNQENLTDVTMFLNLRGDGREHKKQVNILSNISNVVLVYLDISDLNNADVLTEIVLLQNNCKNVVLILSGNKSTAKDQVKKAEDFKEKVKTHIHGDLRIVLPFKGKRQKNASDLKSEIGAQIRESIMGDKYITLEDISELVEKENVYTDEMSQHCQEGKQLAKQVMSNFDKNNKSDLLPLQDKCWKEWCQLLKSKRRSKQPTGEPTSIHVVGKMEEKMENLRLEQQELCNSQSPFIQSFIAGLQCTIDSPSIDFYMQWLKMYLDDVSRHTLPVLHRQYHDKCLSLKAARDAGGLDIQILEKEVKNLELAIANTQIGIEHMMRELGQIFEASCSTNSTRHMQFKELPHLVATLLLRGQALEIMDGDASGVPTTWLNAVLTELEEILGKQSLFNISVIGLQSSGKSTMLNTMFGLQFPVSAGRCTRGVYLQLVKVKAGSSFPFNYVAILDSEGLRAPELGESHFDHDNELATFLIGLGNLTVINIKGENTAEIRDILQIVSHAFLRMKMANENIERERSCVFIHQNVSAVDAEEKMRSGAQKFHDTLDRRTIEAAKLENIANVTSFNQIIRFESDQHIWYFPDLWHGSPPMASVSTEYHQKIRRLKTDLMKSQTKGSQWFFGLSEIKDLIKDMWDGVLDDDFVFSFRNSQVTRAYNLLEDKFSELKREHEVAIRDWLKDIEMGEHETKESLQSHSAKLKNDAVAFICGKQDGIVTELNRFIQNNTYSQILQSWQKDKVDTLQCIIDARCHKVKEEIDGISSKHKVNLMMRKEKQRHKQELFRRAKELAETINNDRNDDDSFLKAEFDKMFNEWIGDISHEQIKNGDIEEILTGLLFEHFKGHFVFVQQELRENPLRRVSSLAGSISEADIPTWNLKSASPKATDQMRINTACHINRIFEEVDTYIQNVSGKFDLSNFKDVLEILAIDLETINPYSNLQYKIQKGLEVQLALRIARHVLKNRLVNKQLTEEIVSILLRQYPRLSKDQLAKELQQVNLEGSIRETMIKPQDLGFIDRTAFRSSVSQNEFSSWRSHAVSKLNTIFRDIDIYLTEASGKSSGFQSHDAREVLKILHDGVGDFHTDIDQRFRFPKQFEVRLAVDVYRYCVPVFHEMQDSYNREYSVTALLDHYMTDSFGFFRNTVKETGKEIIAAELLCGELEHMMKKHIKGEMHDLVLLQINGKYKSKRQLIKGVLEHLAKKESFDAYNEYLQDTRGYVLRWLARETHRTIFKEEANCCWYMDTVEMLLESIIKPIEGAIKQTSEAHYYNRTIGEWIASFSIALSEISHSQCFSEGIVMPQDVDAYEIDDFQNIMDLTEVRLKGVKGKVLAWFWKYIGKTTEWETPAPYEDTFKSLWGCGATCPFCSEPCISSNPNHAVSEEARPTNCHQCIHHRPKGIMQWRHDVSKKLLVENCSFDVHGKGQFLCSSVAHECDSELESEMRYHDNRNYKKYFPDWDIAPSRDMASSDYWKWYFCRYKKEMASASDAEEPKLPASWGRISKLKAMKSLSAYD